MSGASQHNLAPPGIVLDTNVALDWLVFDDPAVAPVARAIRLGRLRWLTCPGTQRELLHMLNHASLAQRVKDPLHARALLAEHATLVADPEPHRLPPRPVCTDPDDQIFIDLALQYSAAWLLSRDKALLKLARKLRPRALAVLRPDDWLAQAQTPESG